MKGLLVKDFSYILKDMKTYALMLVFYVFIFSISNSGGENGAGVLSGMIIMLLFIISMNTFSYDDYNNWNRYALTMPVSRNDLVLSKYVFSLLSFVVGLVLSMVVTIGINTYNGVGDFMETISASIGVGTVYIVYTSLMFPVLFKYGTEKARMLMMAMFLVPALLVFVIVKFFPSVGSGFMRTLSNSNPISIGLITILIMLGVLLISIKISLGIMKKKEF